MRKAIMVAVNENIPNVELQYQLEELKNLAIACDIEITETVIQNILKILPKTYIGKGKLEELKDIISENKYDLVIVNNELSPNQINYMGEYLNTEIYDRTYLILEIFRSRAKTKEAQLQVQVASLKYMLPRLVGMHNNLSRQRGTTAQGTAGGRGPGETKLELDRRNIKMQLTTVQKELANLLKRRKQQRNKRNKSSMKTVCLVGYTNSGKSTLMNALLKHSVAQKKNVLQDDMLFATLETSTRLIHTKNNGKFLVTDTVGFVEEIPHTLIEAFKSTLEEVNEADLLIHVVDASNPNYEKQILTTNGVLKELGAIDKPVIYAFNKIDLLPNNFITANIEGKVVQISALNNNIENILYAIEEVLYHDFLNIKFSAPINNSNLISLIKSEAIIKTMDYQNEDVIIEAKMTNDFYKQILPYIKNSQ